jgi:hypothetical protein
MAKPRISLEKYEASRVAARKAGADEVQSHLEDPSKGSGEAANETGEEAAYSAGFFSAFWSAGFSVSSFGFASRTALLRRFSASSRADPSLRVLE